MTDTLASFYQYAGFSVSPQVLFTTPLAHIYVIRHILLCNEGNRPVKVNVAISSGNVTSYGVESNFGGTGSFGVNFYNGASLAGKTILANVTIEPNSTYDWSGFLVMSPLESILGWASRAGVISPRISGIDVT